MLVMVAVTCGGLLGGIVGGFFVWLLTRRHYEVESVSLPDSFPSDIEGVAAEWARAQGKPEAAGIVADKLRLAHYLGQLKRKQPLRKRRWFR